MEQDNNTDSRRAEQNNRGCDNRACVCVRCVRACVRGADQRHWVHNATTEDGRYNLTWILQLKLDRVAWSLRRR